MRKREREEENRLQSSNLFNGSRFWEPKKSGEPKIKFRNTDAQLSLSLSPSLSLSAPLDNLGVSVGEGAGEPRDDLGQAVAQLLGGAVGHGAE